MWVEISVQEMMDRDIIENGTLTAEIFNEILDIHIRRYASVLGPVCCCSFKTIFYYYVSVDRSTHSYTCVHLCLSIRFNKSFHC